ncbi:lysine N(6)-hydroxylase/L-ornithine N(5)-oxygenase family protein [Candidatus Pantoea multigeneris]|uniref:Lysine N(6)-hydroxylase/L-ornithine N(5)-oxygenase family protein n=1 Tax=Candidatus Pantoea multigeneris TaxID=2608357 RepID=A0ABX0RIG6_9GAMM|nr:SidA/IucD/PvdA family monooxygenase [Pantoea multigeneris]NIF23424.1 lysine N(6)-hydroxylase/L-ornithine N(5)-oxygenase family protein [Pantoea multigeneris]
MIIYDVIGLGFGPSNLAVAAAIEEEYKNLNAVFLEQKNNFIWHKGMLISDATMQISFLKDIATLRNPNSKFSFLSYLHEKNRLEQFANLRTFYPTRIEFNDYFKWVAEKLNDYVIYSQEVTEIRKRTINEESLIEVESINKITGQKEIKITRNVILACGLTPKLTIGKELSEEKGFFHAAHYAYKIKEFTDHNKELNFLVIGGGQSAAEITKDLHAQFKNSSVTCAFSGFGLKPADDSEFVNEVFCTATVDEFFFASSEVRDEILKKHGDTNYSVVDLELIKELYRIAYEEQVTGNKRLKFKKMTRVLEATKRDGKIFVDLHEKMNDIYTHEEYDAVILATGYESDAGIKLLSNMLDELDSNESGNLVVGRNYKVKNKLDLGIYMATGNESTHGLSDTLLSVLAVRANEILKDVSKTTSKYSSYLKEESTIA